MLEITEQIENYLRHFGSYILTHNRIKKKKKIKEGYRDDLKYLNIGGGDFTRKHWRVLDNVTEHYDYNQVFVDFNINLEELEGWPIEKNEYDLVYSSHTLEHLSDDAVLHTLKEINRILKPEGGLRINVPDMDLVMQKYRNKNTGWFTDLWRSKYAHGGYYPKGRCPSGYELEFYVLIFVAGYLALKEYDQIDFGQVRSDLENLEMEEALSKYSSMITDEWQREEPWLHRNWFNFDRLSTLLREAGFYHIERSACRQSRYNEFCYDEFDNHAWMSFYVDAEVK